MFFKATITLALCILGASFAAAGDETSFSYERFLARQYPDLANASAGVVEKIGRKIDADMQLWEKPDKVTPVYKELALRILEEGGKGGESQARMRAVALAQFPPDIVLRAIFPEVEEGGRLQGWFESGKVSLRRSTHSDPRYTEASDFTPCVKYLHSRPARSEVLVREMFRVDPSNALRALVSVEFRLPYSKSEMLRESMQLESEERQQAVRHLLLADHIIFDAIWRQRFGMPASPEQLAAAKQMLRELAGREESWVRLYVAEIMRQNPELYEKDIEALLVKAGDKPIEREPPKAEPPKAETPKVDPPKPDAPPADTPDRTKPPEKPKKRSRQIPLPASYTPPRFTGDSRDPRAVEVELTVPDGAQLANKGPGEVITSFLVLPKDIAIARKFHFGHGDIVRALRESGLVAQPLRKATDVPFELHLSLGESGGYTHGTPYAPFAGSKLQPGDKAGMTLVFARPQAVIAMTILNANIDVDEKVDLVFQDATGKPLRTINADTQWREVLGYQHFSAVFRGLALDKPLIKSVDVKVRESDESEGVKLDYICSSETPLPSVAAEHLSPLLEKLASDSFADRSAAQRELIAIGPRLLFALPEDDQINDDQIRAALESIRQAISASVADPSRDTTED